MVAVAPFRNWQIKVCVMDRKTFEVSVLEFWAYLGLKEPVFSPEPEVTLVVDSYDVLLRHGKDGKTMVIQSDAGAVKNDHARAQSVLETILKTNVALCAERQTIAVLEEFDETGRQRLIVRAFYRYNVEDQEQLSDLVSDVISSVQTLRGLTTGFQDTDRIPVTTKGAAAMRPDNELLVLVP